MAIVILSLVIGGNKLAQADTPDTTPPSVPSGLTATVLLPSQVNLSWTAATDTVGVEGYFIYRNGSKITAINTTSFSDSVAPGTYTYNVTAYDAAGNASIQSASALATLVLDQTSPSAPVNVSAVAVSTSTATTAQITVSWSAATDNIGVTGYYVYRNGTLLTSSTAPFTATSYTDFVPPGMYNYAIAAYDASRNYSDRSSAAAITIVLDVQPPGIPGKLSAVITSPSQITLTWATSTDEIGVKGYNIYRNNSKIGSAGTTSFQDSGLASGNYTYTVTAYDFAGNVSPNSYPVSITFILDDTPPTNPSNLSVAVGPSLVKLSWAASFDSTGVIGYSIYRNGTQIATVSSTQFTYQDSGIATGTYSYSVAAYDLSGNVSNQSFPVSATVLPSTANTTTNQPSATAVAPSTSAVPTPSTSATSAAPAPGTLSPSVNPAITISLYFGLRNDQVKTLQTILAQRGYLASTNATGFFGNLTLEAVKKFQCDNGVVCTGTPGTTGWGFVGAKTRAALSKLAAQASATTSTTASVDQLNAQIQALRTLLINLQLQAQTKTQ